MTVFAFWFDSNKELHYPFLGTRVIEELQCHPGKVHTYVDSLAAIPNYSFSYRQLVIVNAPITR